MRRIIYVLVLSWIQALAGDSLESMVFGERLAVAWDDLPGQSGVLRAISTESPWTYGTPSLSTGPEVMLRYEQQRLYVISSTEGTITIVDPNTWIPLDVYDLGPDSKPQDIFIAGPDRAYISRQNATDLLRLDLDTGQTQEMIDLSVFADEDGIPEMGTMAAYEGRLFIQIRRFENGRPGSFVPPACLAVIDIAAEQLIDTDPDSPGTQGIELQGTFPIGKMQVIPQTKRLFVRATGIPYDNGGIEMIDLRSLRSLGLVVSEASAGLGTDCGGFVMVSSTQGYVVFTTDIVLSSHLYFFTVTGGVDKELGMLHQSLGSYAQILVHDPQHHTFFYPEGGFETSGIHVFDAYTGQRLTTEPVPATGTPHDMALLFQCDRIGDLTHNCRIDLEDFSLFSHSWFTDPNNPQWNPECDISDPRDKLVDMADLAVFTKYWLAGLL